MKHKKKKRGILHSRFYQIYFALVALALVAIGFGLVWVNNELTDYESAEPVYVAENYAELFQNRAFDSLYELDSAAAEISDGDKDFYLKTMHSIADGADIEWSEEMASTDEHSYGVTVDGAKFATFTLVPSGETTERGNRLWTLGSVTTHVTVETPEPPEPPAPEYTFFITAPSNSTVTFEGRTLGSEDATGKTSELFPQGFLPKRLTAPTLVEYKAVTHSENPEISVVDRDGNPQELQASEGDSHVLSCGLPYDEEMQKRYSKGVVKVAKHLARFTSEDETMYSMRSLCFTKSPAYKIINSFDNQWAPLHRKVAFKNMKVEEFYQHSPECLTCSVSFDYVLTGYNHQKKTYKTSYRFCFVRDGRNSKLYNLQLN